jgi:hypothetical protein
VHTDPWRRRATATLVRSRWQTCPASARRCSWCSKDTSYRSRLEAVEGDTISVTALLEIEGAAAPLPGQLIEVFWAEPRARVIQPCRLVRIAAAAPYQWIFEPIGEPRKSNRREFVRGGGPAVALGTDEDVRRLNGKLLDISEGGLRCWVPEAGGVKVGDRMSASLRLSTGSLEQDGAVHTVRPAYDEAGHQRGDRAVDPSARLRVGTGRAQSQHRLLNGPGHPAGPSPVRFPLGGVGDLVNVAAVDARREDVRLVVVGPEAPRLAHPRRILRQSLTTLAALTAAGHAGPGVEPPPGGPDR